MRIQMFALPYAGGSASIYSDWESKFKPDVELCPIEYAGHASRFCDPFYTSIEEAAEDISELIIRQQKGDYIIYGHSMGCLIALETAFVLEKKKANLPKAVIVAATRPPHLLYKDKPLGDLSKEELLKEIASLGQIDQEVLECEELCEMIADILYADVQMNTHYNRNYENGTINIPILSLTAEEDDEAPADDMREWQKYTSSEFSFHQFKGNHFFAFEDNDDFLSYLLKYVQSIV